MGRGRRPRHRSDDGAAAVEFALVAPLLIFLLFAIISYGYMLSFRQGLSQAAAEGARRAAVAVPGAGDRTALAAQAVNDALNSYGVTCDAASGDLRWHGGRAGACLISLSSCTEEATEQCVTVSLDFEYRKNALVPGLSLPGLEFVLPQHLEYTTVAEVS